MTCYGCIPDHETPTTTGSERSIADERHGSSELLRRPRRGRVEAPRRDPCEPHGVREHDGVSGPLSARSQPCSVGHVRFHRRSTGRSLGRASACARRGRRSGPIRRLARRAGVRGSSLRLEHRTGPDRARANGGTRSRRSGSVPAGRHPCAPVRDQRLRCGLFARRPSHTSSTRPNANARWPNSGGSRATAHRCSSR